MKWLDSIMREQRRLAEMDRIRKTLGIAGQLIYEHNDTADLFLDRCCESGIVHIHYMKGPNDSPIVVTFRNDITASLENTKIGPSDYAGWLSRGKFTNAEGEEMFSYVNSQPSLKTMYRFYMLMNEHMVDHWLK